jgi:hypothetical protein
MHFARELVFWECREKLASETDASFPYLEDVSTTMTDPRPLKAFIDTHKRRHLGLSSSGVISANIGENQYAHTDFYYYWCQFLGAYTKCYLTKGDDILVALQGIVQDISETLKINIVAGMCTEYLIAELCWYSEMKEEARRPALAFSPSWSWISSTRLVKFAGCSRNFEPLNHCMASVSSFEVDTTPSGELTHASLSLDCGLIPLNHHYDADLDTYKFTLGPERAPWILGYIYAPLQHDTAVFTSRFQHLQCYFVPLYYSTDARWGSVAEGMTVVPSEDHPGCYRRVGYCFQHDRNTDPDWNKVEVYSAMEKRIIELV